MVTVSKVLGFEQTMIHKKKSQVAFIVFDQEAVDGNFTEQPHCTSSTYLSAADGNRLYFDILNQMQSISIQFCLSIPLLGFPVFCSSSSIVLNRYFHIFVNSMFI